MISWKRLLLAALVVLPIGAAPATADAQLGDKLKNKIKQRVDRAADQTVDKGLDEVEGAVRCVVSDSACIEQAKKDGKEVVLTDAEGNEVSGAAGATGEAPAAAYVNYDFVPGTRPLFVDDFTRDNVGDFPRRLEFGDGNMEVAEWRGTRFLRVTSWPGSFSIVLPEQLPERFTIEFDATPGYAHNYTIFKFSGDSDSDVRFRRHNGKGQGGVFGPNHQTLGFTSREIGEEDVYRGRIMADGQYVKVYINETRVANIPNANLGRSNKITIEMPGKEDSPAFIGNISIMAGGKKLYDALATEGRVATQGIYFDTGSDRIRPESNPTLKEIGEMLKEHSDLRLTIEGHTDSVGDDAANQALSEKRAAAVKQHLVSNYGVDAGRIEAKGLGESKPAGSNDTPEGRQQNRRVELVRM